MSNSSPVFVFGVARSGTNLIARMLDAHPQVAVALDALLPLFRAWRNLTFGRAALQAPAAVAGDTAPIQDYYFVQHGPALLDLIFDASAEVPVSPQALEALRQSVQQRAALESAPLAARFASWKGATINELFDGARGIFVDAALAQGKKEILWSGTKEVWTVEFVLPLARAFPEARFVAIHRDPRAVVASLLKLAAQDASQAAHWVSYMRHWRKHAVLAEYFASLPELEGRFLTLRYEDLVTEPAREAKRAAAFLGIPFAGAMLTLGGGSWDGNSSFGPNHVPIESAHKDHWRTHLHADMLAAIEFLCRPEMKLLGYRCAAPVRDAGAEVIEAIMDAHRNPGSWRSDSGDPAMDFAWERLRLAMLDPAVRQWPRDWVRRCFLVAELRDALIKANRGG